MALKSRTEILNEGANADGASNEAILMAALNESQQEYKRLSGKLLLAFESYDKRIEALEAAVRASNTEKVQDYTEALSEAADKVLDDVQGELDTLKTEVQQTVWALQGARKQKEKDEFADNMKWLAGTFVVVALAFYVALLMYGWWYDIPEAIGKLDAVNNGIYQLLNKP